MKMLYFRCACYMICILSLLLTSCAGNHPGQTYPDAPSSLWADDGVLATGNYGGTLAQPYTVGFDIQNQGSSPITLDSFTFVSAPPNVTILAVAIARPDENDKGLLEVGELGYPPVLPTLHRPWIFHPLKNAVVHAHEYLEAIISLRSSKQGAFLVKGFLLTLEMNGTTYQHYFPTTVVLCINVSHAVCEQAFKKAGVH